ncbi:hypothetical protein H4P12_15025 [Paracoccus sp. 11-3]|uniref:Uncharacterized protein n=1 Tax=Paracoccus amoyensis TaxID=2760093 RepID=A0A926JDE0_9RHOB|nr:hypothetical protein [Paracoccus amoyensis]MBC9247990.1 hypothetical protein [Paracoccus amoyensis]
MVAVMALPPEPRQDVIPQQMLIIRLYLKAAEADKNMLAELVANPGFPIDSWAFPAFNDHCRQEAGLTEVLLDLGNKGALSALGGIGCTLCKIAAHTVAIAIVAVGAGALSLLTAGSGSWRPICANGRGPAHKSLAQIAGQVELGKPNCCYGFPAL